MQTQQNCKALISCPLLSAADPSHAPCTIVASHRAQGWECAPIASRTCTLAAVVLAGIVFLAFAAGCADTRVPAARIARESGFQEDLIQGAGFRHRIYRHLPPDGVAGVLHIYIEGDGRPFIAHTFVTADPTPRDPLMLHLMALDPAPSVYLGRPCYFGLAHDRGCNSSFWTLKRFSPEVIASLAAALRSEAERVQASSIEIYGHSGGGTLAVLLAARVPRVTHVITIGATLDIAAWCSLHGYSPLLGSMNPARSHLDLEGIRVLHLVGSEDTNTPPEFVKSAAAQMGAEDAVRVIPGYTHNCCWQELWRAALGGSL